MKRTILLIGVFMLLSTAFAFAGGGKVQERNPEFNGDVDFTHHIQHQEDVHGK
ncbi:MAG: hypothetical protein JEZ08_02470 [Clostridiales bacterium]|nr:hypothetical protein [Clostridiales bacterium]